MEMGLCFLFFLSNYWRASFDSEQMDWAAGLPLFSSSTSQRFRRTLHLMALLCSMIAWNGLIPRLVAIAWSGTVKRFLFLYLGQLCH